MILQQVPGKDKKVSYQGMSRAAVSSPMGDRRLMSQASLPGGLRCNLQQDTRLGGTPERRGPDRFPRGKQSGVPAGVSGNLVAVNGCPSCELHHRRRITKSPIRSPRTGSSTWKRSAMEAKSAMARLRRRRRACGRGGSDPAWDHPGGIRVVGIGREVEVVRSRQVVSSSLR